MEFLKPFYISKEKHGKFTIKKTFYTNLVGHAGTVTGWTNRLGSGKFLVQHICLRHDHPGPKTRRLDGGR
jgi:hypothetical protein